MKTFAEIEEELRRLDELTILELLEISADDLVDHFQDKIEDKFDELQEALSEPTQGTED